MRTITQRLPQYTVFFLFILVAIVCGEEKHKDNTPPYRLIAHVNSTYHIPFMHVDHWAPYFTSGLSFSLPTYYENLSTRVSAEAGKIFRKENKDVDYMIFHFSIDVGYRYMFTKNIGANGSVGLINVMRALSEMTKKEFLNPIAHLENEFGGMIMIEPLVKFNRILITLPISGKVVLTEPRVFTTIDFSLTAGVTF